jgi:adenylate cyclase
MTFGAHAVRSKLRGAVNARSLRLWSGLVLGLFLLMHFSNIGLGLISTGVMDAAAPWLMAPWRTPPGTALLSGALLAHFCLALRALYRRQTLRMSRREGAQLALACSSLSCLCRMSSWRASSPA